MVEISWLSMDRSSARAVCWRPHNQQHQINLFTFQKLASVLILNPSNSWKSFYARTKIMESFDLAKLELLFHDIITSYNLRRDEVIKSDDVDDLLQCLEIYQNLGMYIHKRILGVTSVSLNMEEEEKKEQEEEEKDMKAKEVERKVDERASNGIANGGDESEAQEACYETEIEATSSLLVERLIGRQVGFGDNNGEQVTEVRFYLLWWYQSSYHYSFLFTNYNSIVTTKSCTRSRPNRIP